MEDADGFFPERRLLAYRRSQMRPKPVPPTRTSQNSSAWWILLVCLVPSYIPIWMSMLPLHGHLPLTLLYSLVACFLIVAVAGVCFGVYMGLRTHKRLTRT